MPSIDEDSTEHPLVNWEGGASLAILVLGMVVQAVVEGFVGEIAGYIPWIVASAFAFVLAIRAMVRGGALSRCVAIVTLLFLSLVWLGLYAKYLA